MATIDAQRHDAHEWSALEVAERLREGTTTSRDLVAALLARVDELDGPDTPVALRAMIAIASDAMDQATAADASRAAGASRSVLHGVPIVVKDNVEAMGLPGTAGATSLEGRPVHADAPLVARLRDAGMIVLGSTNLSQWANLRSPRSTSGWSAVGGLTCNPYRLDRSAGGSSSGSGAALAARLAPLAIGTETDGSITCPASLNGVVGLKPAVGTISTVGVVPLAASHDSPGPMARTVADVAALYDVLCDGASASSRVASGAADVRVGVARGLRTKHPATDAAFDDLMVRLGHSVGSLVDVELPAPDGEVRSDELTVVVSEMADDLTAYLAARGGPGPRSVAEAIAHEDAHADVELAHFGHEFFEQAVASGGRASPAYAPARARNLAWAVGTSLEPALRDVDVVVAPALGPAWKSDLTLGDTVTTNSGICTAAAIAGWPIATVPFGLVDGLPVGLSVVGRPGDEALLLAVAVAVESAAGLLADGALRPSFDAPRRA